MAVTVPQGMQGGMSLQVQTPAGLMEVTIPQGLQGGQSFEMMVPMVPQQAVAQAQQPPMAQVDSPASWRLGGSCGAFNWGF